MRACGELAPDRRAKPSEGALRGSTPREPKRSEGATRWEALGELLSGLEGRTAARPPTATGDGRRRSGLWMVGTGTEGLWRVDGAL